MYRGRSSVLFTWRTSWPRFSDGPLTCANVQESSKVGIVSGANQSYRVRCRLSSEDSGLLEDILESARLAISYAQGTTEARFHSDQMRQDAVAYRIGIIGEAARSLSVQTKGALHRDM